MSKDAATLGSEAPVWAGAEKSYDRKSRSGGDESREMKRGRNRYEEKYTFMSHATQLPYDMVLLLRAVRSKVDNITHLDLRGNRLNAAFGWKLIKAGVGSNVWTFDDVVMQR